LQFLVSLAHFVGKEGNDGGVRVRNAGADRKPEEYLKTEIAHF